jgi:hypothetical protein
MHSTIKAIPEGIELIPKIFKVYPENKKALQIFDLQGVIILKCTQSRGRTGTTLRLLVFETNASTNSAIWAFTSKNA